MENIGHLQYEVYSNSGLLNLGYNASKECSMNFALLDEMGKFIFEQNINTDKGKTSIQLKIPALKTGKYNAWIEMGEQIYLRRLTIAKTPSISWMDKLKKWLFIYDTHQPLIVVRASAV